MSSGTQGGAGVGPTEAAGQESSSAGPGNIIRFTVGQAVSNIGSWMQKTAIGWTAWELTHSAAWVGAVALTDLIAALWVAPFAGAMADRSNPYHQLWKTQSALLLLTICMGLIAMTGRIDIWLLMAFALAEATLQGFNQPVRTIATSMLAGPARMSQAIAANSIAFNGARSIGPAIAGLLLAGGHTGLVFLSNGLSYLAMLAIMVTLRHELDRPPPPVRNALAADIREGFTYITGTPQIAMVFFLTVTFSLLARPFGELFPAFAGAVFQGGPQTLSLMMSTQGIGALIGAAWMLKTRGKRELTAICYGAALGTGVMIAAFAASPSLYFALPALGLAGLFHVVCNIGMQSLAQLSAAPGLRGRVMSMYGLIFRTGPSIGAFLIGVGANLFGLRLLVGGGALLFAALVALILPRARRIHADPQDIKI